MIGIIGKKIKKIQKEIVRHNALVLLGIEKPYRAQQIEYNQKIQKELQETFKREPGERCEEWLKRIDQVTDESMNGLGEVGIESDEMNIVGQIGRLAWEEMSTYCVIPFIELMLHALHETSEENSLDRNYGTVIMKFNCFRSNTELSLFNLFSETGRIMSGERGLGARAWSIYYDVKRVLKKYCETGIMEDIQSDELFKPSLLEEMIGAGIVLAGIVMKECAKASADSKEVQVLPDK